MTPKEALSHEFITKIRFIPRPSENKFKERRVIDEPKTQTLTRKPALIRNKYASTTLVNLDSTSDVTVNTPKLHVKSSLGSFKSRLPIVPSLTRLGEHISSAVKIGKDRASTLKRTSETYLPPISNRNDSRSMLNYRYEGYGRAQETPNKAIWK
jgi:hypothetical protein